MKKLIVGGPIIQDFPLADIPEETTSLIAVMVANDAVRDELNRLDAVMGVASLSKELILPYLNSENQLDTYTSGLLGGMAIYGAINSMVNPKEIPKPLSATLGLTLQMREMSDSDNGIRNFLTECRYGLMTHLPNFTDAVLECASKDGKPSELYIAGAGFAREIHIGLLDS